MAFLHPRDIPVQALEDAKAHALREYPKESCGVISNGAYYPQQNIAAQPEEGFEIDASVVVSFGNTLKAVLHSHPKGGREPSAMDIQSQQALGCLFGILPCNSAELVAPISWFGDYLLDEPLIGREFVHGVTDCYSVIRAYFWQTKMVYLPDMPRDNLWWDSGDNLYAERYKDYGFRAIEASEVVEGDVFLGKVRSPVPNHGGVFLGRGLGLHHLAGRLSRREPILRWRSFMTHFLRYEGS